MGNDVRRGVVRQITIPVGQGSRCLMPMVRPVCR